MSDFIHRLISRTRGHMPLVEPLIAPRFSGEGTSSDLTEVHAETDQHGVSEQRSATLSTKTDKGGESRGHTTSPATKTAVATTQVTAPAISSSTASPIMRKAGPLRPASQSISQSHTPASGNMPATGNTSIQEDVSTHKTRSDIPEPLVELHNTHAEREMSAISNAPVRASSGDSISTSSTSAIRKVNQANDFVQDGLPGDVRETAAPTLSASAETAPTQIAGVSRHNVSVRDSESREPSSSTFERNAGTEKTDFIHQESSTEHRLVHTTVEGEKAPLGKISREDQKPPVEHLMESVRKNQGVTDAHQSGNGFHANHLPSQSKLTQTPITKEASPQTRTHATRRASMETSAQESQSKPGANSAQRVPTEHIVSRTSSSSHVQTEKESPGRTENSSSLRNTVHSTNARNENGRRPHEAIYSKDGTAFNGANSNPLFAPDSKHHDDIKNSGPLESRDGFRDPQKTIAPRVNKTPQHEDVSARLARFAHPESRVESKVQVNIGRVEINAGDTAPPQMPDITLPPARKPTVSLEDYLKRRNGAAS